MLLEVTDVKQGNKKKKNTAQAAHRVLLTGNRHKGPKKNPRDSNYMPKGDEGYCSLDTSKRNLKYVLSSLMNH